MPCALCCSLDISKVDHSVLLPGYYRAVCRTCQYDWWESEDSPWTEHNAAREELLKRKDG